MKLAVSLSFSLAFSTVSHGYILDKSCLNDKQIIVEGMKGAFQLAQSAEQAFTQLSQSTTGDTGVAQKDLLSYLFAETLTGGNIDPKNNKWKLAKGIPSQVLKYNRGDGQPDITPLHYKGLPTDRLILFCNYDRFKENEDCVGNPKPGYTCDTSIGVFFPMNDIYSDCKEETVFSSSVQVGQPKPAKYRKGCAAQYIDH